MRIFLLGMLMLGATAASAQQIDTLKVYELQDVQVVSTRATQKTPMAFTNMNREQLNQVNYGKDVPALLATMPSITTTTDAGNGIGYSSFRVRGTDPSRINITANGVPLNDSESSLVYFSNMGDFTSSVQSVQIQRGVGTSTNGAGAFGATVNMLTEPIGTKPYVGFDVSAGSYDTHKETLRFGTGLIGERFGIQGRLSNIGSNGYIDRATSRLNSYFLQAGYFHNNTTVKFITFNGTERTYMAWNYASKYEQSLYGRRYNSCGLYYDKDGNRRFYEDQYDNYHQQHYQLHWNQRINRFWNTNVALHYTHDNYDYDQMKTGKKLYKWGLTTDTDIRGDLVQRKDGKKDFYGIVASANYDNTKGLTLNLGGGLNRFDADRAGHVLWVGVPYYKGSDAVVALPELQPKFEYYNNDSRKTDGNIYAKANWEFLPGLSAFVDMQYRHINYKMNGFVDEWTKNGLERNDLERSYNFFNPKAGLNYSFAKNHRIYASYAIAHREPTRDHYQEMWGKEVNAERLYDLELGYKYQTEQFAAGINLYHMNYKDQFVLTGELNDEGEAVTKNLPKSYRMGVELEAAWKPTDWFRWDANATFSRNRVKDMIVTLDDYVTEVNIGDQPLSFSPNAIINNTFTFSYKNIDASLRSQYISKQYMTNYGAKTMKCWNDWNNTGDLALATDETLMLNSHFTTDIDLSYTFAIPSCGIKSGAVGITLYNLFSKKYDNNGWAAPQFKQDANGNVYALNTWGLGDSEAVGFAASAPFHFLVHLSLNF